MHISPLGGLKSINPRAPEERYARLKPLALYRQNSPRFQSGEFTLGQLPAFGTPEARELSTADPRNLLSLRLEEIRAKEAQFPGRKLGGSGLTGLMSSDAQGWSAMLNEQIEAKNIENELRGQSPVTVKPGGELGGMSPSIADQPDWWLQGEPDPREVTGQNLPRIRQNMQTMPASLHSLYADRFRQK